MHMLPFDDMLIRLGIAILLGAIIGVERELAGKAAGLRTDVLVAAGSAIFTMAGLLLPHLVASNGEELSRIIAGNSGWMILIGNIVVGIGFLGAGIIVQHGVHVYGVTTAATVWLVAAIGLLCGLGLTTFAVAATALVVILLILLRHLDIHRMFRKSAE